VWVGTNEKKTGVLVNKCDIFENRCGIYVDTGNIVNIQYSSIHNNQGTGICLSGKDGPPNFPQTIQGRTTIVHSVIRDNGGNGLNVEGQWAAVDQCKVNGNGRSGIRIGDGGSGDITNNDLTKNMMLSISGSGAIRKQDNKESIRLLGFLSNWTQ